MLPEATYWDALQNRDQRYDGIFFYGVVTTGVFCRPSCKTRLALKKNILFFNKVAEAEAAGFRACKKCNPKGAKNQIQDVVYELCRHIEANVSESLSLQALAQKAGYSVAHLQKSFRVATGSSPKAYHEALRQ